ncbi:MAG: hypothetical protein GX154_11455 [Clostridiales bacterium]|nr:hypothetical protein [Clostridiales bacterium]
MGYGRNNRNENSYAGEEIKNKIKEKLPNIDLEQINQEDVKDILLNEIGKNPNINQNVKNMINQGDINGLKEELVKYLDSRGGSDSSSMRIKNMLESNDYEGLQNELMGTLFKSATGQKKNEVNEEQSTKNPFTGILNEAFLSNALSRVSAGNKNDNRINLLNSIKPFMSSGRQKVIDECIMAVNLLIMAEKLGLKVGK